MSLVGRYTQMTKKKSWVDPKSRRNNSDFDNDPVNIELENIMNSVKDEGSIDRAIN